MDSEGTRNPLERIRDRVSEPHAGLSVLQREIAAEAAASLGRAAQRVRDALGRLDDIEARIDAAKENGDGASMAELVSAYNTERDEALVRLRYLKIQREALGLRRHDELDRYYPVPSRKALE